VMRLLARFELLAMCPIALAIGFGLALAVR
jgi:hypothetical protein